MKYSDKDIAQMTKAIDAELVRVQEEWNRKVFAVDSGCVAPGHNETIRIEPVTPQPMRFDEPDLEDDEPYNGRASALADECQTLRDSNTHLLADNARLRRQIERMGRKR